MIFLVEATYPGTKAMELATASLEYLKTNPPPEGVKIIEYYAFAGGDGYRLLMFYEIETGKEEEGLNWISTGEVQSLNTIEGYKINTSVVYPMAPALEFLDMEAPKF